MPSANSPSSGASPPTCPQETGSLFRQKVTVPVCCSEVSVVTAPFLSEGPSRSLSGTPPARHPLLGWLLSDLSVGSLKGTLMGGSGEGPKQRAEGEHLGTSVAEIRDPCSLLPVVFVTEQRVDSSRQDRNPPGIKKHGPRLTRVRLWREACQGMSKVGKLSSSEIMIPGDSVQVEDRQQRKGGEKGEEEREREAKRKN